MAASWLAASPPQPGDGYLRRRDERHGAAGLQPALTGGCLPAGGVRAVRRLAGPTAGHVDGELSTGGNVQLGEHVREVGLHGTTRYVQPLADLGIGQSLGDQAGDRVLGGGEAGPADLRTAACPAPAAPDARLAQCGFGAGQVTGGAEPLVDAERLIEERAGAV